MKIYDMLFAASSGDYETLNIIADESGRDEMAIQWDSTGASELLIEGRLSASLPFVVIDTLTETGIFPYAAVKELRLTLTAGANAYASVRF